MPLATLSLTENAASPWYAGEAQLNQMFLETYSACAVFAALDAVSFDSSTRVYFDPRATLGVPDAGACEVMFEKLYAGFAAVGVAESQSLGLSRAALDPHGNGGVLWGKDVTSVNTNFTQLYAAIGILEPLHSYAIAPGTAALACTGAAPARRQS